MLTRSQILQQEKIWNKRKKAKYNYEVKHYLDDHVFQRNTIIVVI